MTRDFAITLHQAHSIQVVDKKHTNMLSRSKDLSPLQQLCKGEQDVEGCRRVAFNTECTTNTNKAPQGSGTNISSQLIQISVENSSKPGCTGGNLHSDEKKVAGEKLGETGGSK